MNGTFEEFLAALLAFESGWDRARYETNQIQDWQLDQWAGGAVTDFFPQYSSWGDLTDEEWQSMAYRSTNALGFVGYQFGEALLIDLGYYDDDFFYGNGAASNTWDGTWTGKNGIDSLEEFMTEAAQEVAIREAFGYNLTIIQDLLSAHGESLEDYLGKTISYSDNGVWVSVELTLTGILAAAHLRGAWGTVDLLRGGSVSKDEYGTSILQYIDQFGGYESPDIDTQIGYFTDRLTGDEGLGDGAGGGGNGTAGVTADTADVVIDWASGQNEIINNFDPDNGTIFIGWFNSGHIDVYEENGNVVFAIPSNNQTTTLLGVSLAELSAANFTILDDTAAQEILALVGTPDNGDSDPGNGDSDSGNGDPDSGNGDPDSGNGDAGGGDNGNDDGGGTGGGAEGGNGTAGVTKETATVVITWAWGTDHVVSDFDPSSDTIFVDWFGPENIDVSEVGGNVVFSMPNNNQTVTLEGISLADLSAANFTIMHDQTAQDILAAIGSAGNGNGDTGSGNDDPDSGNGDSGDNDHGDSGDNDHGDNDHGDNGNNDGGGTGGGADGGNGTAGVTKETATVVITWAWGTDHVVPDFDPSADTIFVDWFGPENIDVSEVGGNVVFSLPNNNQTVTLEGISLADLSAANFTIMHDQTAQEILSQVGGDAHGGGSDGAGGNVGPFEVVYDNDGSDPPQTAGVTDAGGVKYHADYYADDIVNFDVNRDELDFGDTSVHNMIINKTPQGELIIDNPWWDDMQIVQGVQFNEFSIENFGIVGNEHFRQDIGGVLSWELGIGPRESDTVYIRSHEYGVHEVIDNFDPASMKISFLYYGTRERLSVEDTDDGLVISTQPSGQSFTFTGITLADLQPGTLEFHHDQVMEDRLEEPFGFNQNDVGLVSREALLTPEAPVGAITDGHQVREGVMWSTASTDNADEVFDFSALTVQDDGLSQTETELMFEELTDRGRHPAGRDGRREDRTEEDQDRSDTDRDGASDGSDALQDPLPILSDQEIA